MSAEEMGSAALALQQALFARLSGDAALTAKLGAGRIYDAVPGGAALPFAVLGDSDEADLSASQLCLARHEGQMSVWSKAAGRREVKELLSLARTALLAAPLDIAPFRLIDFTLPRAEVVLAEKNSRREGRLFWRALVETPQS